MPSKLQVKVDFTKSKIQEKAKLVKLEKGIEKLINELSLEYMIDLPDFLIAESMVDHFKNLSNVHRSYVKLKGRK